MHRTKPFARPAVRAKAVISSKAQVALSKTLEHIKLIRRELHESHASRKVGVDSIISQALQAQVISVRCSHGPCFSRLQL